MLCLPLLAVFRRYSPTSRLIRTSQSAEETTIDVLFHIAVASYAKLPQ